MRQRDQSIARLPGVPKTKRLVRPEPGARFLGVKQTFLCVLDALRMALGRRAPLAAWFC
jgi:hypothetical protein